MAAESSIVSGIAGRYATALFDLARDTKALDQVATDLSQLQAMLAGSADLTRLIRSPMFGRADQSRAMAAVLDKAGSGELVKRFIGVVAENRRLFTLPDIIRDFRRLLARHRGETVAEISSAVALTPEQLNSLKTALVAAIGRDVTLASKVDPDLIGGLVVQVGSRMVDASIRNKLNNLQVAMKGVG